MNDKKSYKQRDFIKILNNLEKVRVMIFLYDCVIIGQVLCFSNSRFLDMLNEGLILDEYRIKDFLIVKQPLLINLDGKKKKMSGPWFIKKDSVSFIGTFDETKSTTSEVVNSHRFYPWREKNRMLVTIVLNGQHNLVGEFHNDPWSLPILAIDSYKIFIPMTNVIVSSSLMPQEINFDFIAVNKNQTHLIKISPLID